MGLIIILATNDIIKGTSTSEYFQCLYNTYGDGSICRTLYFTHFSGERSLHIITKDVSKGR